MVLKTLDFHMEPCILEVIKLTEAETNLIRLIRDLRHGKLEVFVQESQPVRAENVRQSIKL